MSKQREHFLTPIPENIPSDLKAYDHWVVWKAVERGGKQTKPPYNPRTGKASKANDPKTWSDFETAWTAYTESGGKYDGIGFQLTEDLGIAGFDFDHCVVDGKPDRWAAEFIETLNAYTETSPSGDGLRVLSFGEIPKGRRKNGPKEVYNSGRYLTITGHRLEGMPKGLVGRADEVLKVYHQIFGTAPKPAADSRKRTDPPKGPLSVQELLEKASNSKSGDKFRALWNNQGWEDFLKGDDKSHSAADMSLCRELAFWLNKDPAAIDEAFRRSGLMRPKWDERHGKETYGATTIRKAIAKTGETYQGRADTGGGASIRVEGGADGGHGNDDEDDDTIVQFDESNCPPIPVEMVPSPLRDFALSVSESIQTPFELPFINSLAAVAVSAQGKYKVRVKADYSEHVNLYAACSLPPGERKSTVVAICKSPLFKWERDERLIMEPEKRRAESARQTLEGRIKAKRQEAAKANDDDLDGIMYEIERLEEQLPEIPVFKRLLVDDFTPETLAGIMVQQEERIGLIEAEGGIFDTIAGRYSNGVPNMDIFLKAYTGESARIDRQGKDPIELESPLLTFCVSPQPIVIKDLELKPGFKARGLIGRFIFLNPPSLMGKRKFDTDPIPATLKDEYRNLIHRILKADRLFKADGRKAPHQINLSKKAYSRLRDFSESVEKQFKPGGSLEFMGDWGSRATGQAVRIAGLFHIINEKTPEDVEISHGTMEQALAIAAVLIDHARVTYSMMKADLVSELARDIARWIEENRLKAITGRTCLDRFKGRGCNMRDHILPSLEALVERGYIFRPETPENKGRGRPKSPIYRVNQKFFEEHTTACRPAASSA